MLALRHYSSSLNSFLRPLATSPHHFGTSSGELRKNIPLEEKLGLPPKPKRPLTPYVKFATSSYRNIVPEGVKATNATKFIAEAWRKIDATTKKNALDEYRQALKEYSQLLKNYMDSLSESEKLKLNAAKVEKEASKKKRQHLLESKKMGKPSRPPSAYSSFVADIAKKFDTPYRITAETSKEISKQWNSLDPDLKANMKNKAQARRQEYEKKLLEWEAEMIKQGKESLVRLKSRPDLQQTPQRVRAKKADSPAVFSV